MPRGGARQNAGRKTGWASGCKFSDTQTIRVPKYLAAEVLELARKLDEARFLDLVSKSEGIDFTESPSVSSCSEHEGSLSSDADLERVDIPAVQPLLISLDALHPDGVTVDELAQRLGVKPVTVRRTRDKKRSHPGAFEAWLHQKDPDGIFWRYDAERNLYIKLDS